MDEITSFGQWLRRARKARDLTQAELAQRVGCATGTIRNLEADALRPSKQLAARLAAQLDLADAQATVIAFARGGDIPPRLPPQPVPPSLREHAPPTEGRVDLPSGTVTFLFTDIEGSTKHWEQHPQEMTRALAQHNALLRQTIAAHGGYVFKTVADGVCAAFGRPLTAVAAAVAGQQALQQADWGAVGPLQVRMALHSGVAETQAGDYQGLPVSRVARLLSLGHGGQILLSRATQELVCDALPPEVTLRDLGASRLKDVNRPERIFQVVAPGLPADFPPLKTLDADQTNLPAQPTAFVGREHELATVCLLLRQADARLVTLTGPGGVGKTRLAIQAAVDLLADFADGVSFVDLAPIREPEQVIATIAQVLGVKESGGRRLLESLKTSLRGKHLLLLLDNFEQVVAAAPQLADLLAGVPHLKLLVTSRVTLHLRGEKEFVVPPFKLPDPQQLPPLAALSQYAAVQLFIARARDVQPGFAVTNDNARAVAEICYRLDGLPLAIELAAARIKLFPPQALLARLDRRLRLLTGGPHDLPVRHQTLRRTLDWSYDLLDPDLQTLFARLAVFVGGGTLEAVEAVCNASGDVALDMLDGLAALVDHSLLRQEVGADGEARFTLLATIHEYASERLNQRGEAAVLRRQHAHFFLALAEEADAKLMGEEQPRWLSRLDTENDNLWAALAWCQPPKGEAELGLRFGVALWYFWEIRGYLHEGRRWLEEMLAQAPERTVLRARALNGAGALASDQGDYAAAYTRYAESLAIMHELGDQRGVAVSLGNLGNIALVQGDGTAARVRYEESLAIFQVLDDQWSIARGLHNLGNVAREQQDYAAAHALFEESLAVRRELGDQWGIAMSLHDQGYVALDQGDDRRAAALFEESLGLFRELRDRSGIAFALHNLGQVAWNQDNYTAAHALFEESLAIRRELGDKLGMAACLGGLAAVARAQDQPERAARLLGALEALLETIGGHLDAPQRAAYERNVAAVCATLEECRFAGAWAAGRAMTMEQVIAYALNGDA